MACLISWVCIQVGQGGRVESLAVFEEFEPALLFGLDRIGVELVQLQQPDAAVVEQAATLGVAQAEAVGIVGAVAQQVFAQQPDGIGGLEGAVILAAVQLGAVEVGPGVEDAREQVAMGQQLDFDLMQTVALVVRALMSTMLSLSSRNSRSL